MAGASTEESGAGRSLEGVSNGQKHGCQSGEALAEWRSSEQVENGSPSTSPPYWDSDDDDGVPKPAELYGKYTWKIDKFSQINKRELRSKEFEVGGYKWYILIYPHGCDVCNHLSLFLCVAHHEKLLPGWSHFAQFTIAVVNKDPKKSKYSDTLHRFWKKEHDWGWKKFMELQKVMDGFIDADTLIIKAQVQVIRERADRPFRCLDCQYRRELVRVYLTNVEQICRRFVEERRNKLGKLIEDKARWSSFCAFWLGMNQSSRHRMSREVTESILKVVVKHFFIEKEVTSTLVMDSLYSGLKALEGQNKGKKSKVIEAAEELPAPIIRVEKDMFVLVDDVLVLLERAAIEPLPPKDEKGPQNRTKDGTTGEEFNKDSIERDERRLTELGRRTIEIFVLAHIFSKIEVAYQEAVALKKQEELIREEEAAWLAEVELKARRAADKEKKSKKKQGKQKKNNRKGKDKGKDDKISSTELEKLEQDNPPAEGKDIAAEPEMVLEKSEVVEDVSDVSDSVDGVAETRDFEDRDVGPINWDADPPSSSWISVQNGIERRGPSAVDDCSSTSSSDSVPSVVINSPNKASSHHQKNQKSPSRGKKNMSKLTSDSTDWVNEEPSQPSETMRDARHSNGASQTQSSSKVRSLSQAAVRSFQDRVISGTDTQGGKKEEEAISVHGKFSVEEAADVERAPTASSPPRSPSKSSQSIPQPKLESKSNTVRDPLMVKNQSSKGLKQTDAATSKPNPHKHTTQKPAEGHEIKVRTDKPAVPPTPIMSRPLSAPLVPGPRPNVSMIEPTPQTPPILARSVSAVGRLGPESTPSTTQGYIPQSYRNAIVGSPISTNSATNASPSFSHSGPAHISNTIKPNLSFGMLSHQDMLQNGGSLWAGHPQRNGSMQSFDLYNPVPCTRLQDHRPSQLPDEFPHLDIINELLEDNSSYQSLGNRPFSLNRHHSFPGEPPMSNGLGPSCRFDRARSFHEDGFQHGYGAPGRSYDALRDMIPQVNPRPYVNGQIDGFLPNQWQMGGSDLLYAGGLRNIESDGYPYHVPEYGNGNLNVGINGYTMFGPSNGL